MSGEVSASASVSVLLNSPEDPNRTEEKTSCCEELEERLKRSQKENTELKRQRTEDAKSNEKVACMFATQEQNWIAEKRSLRLQIQALFAQFRVIETQKEEKISCLKKTVEEKEREMQVKNKEVEEAVEKNGLLEQKLRNTEQAVDGLNQKLEKQSDDHSGEISRLMSKQQQLEFMKLELDEALQRKNEAIEAVKKVSEDKDQKEKILSAILRKSKHDSAERKMLLKEMKMSKIRRKQAELEAERWRASAACEPRRRRKMGSRRLLLNEEEDAIVTGESMKRPADELIMIDVKHLQEWIESETEKCTAAVEQRQCAEIEAFAEQMRMKDEKMEDLRWKLLSAEVEHKRLQTRIYDLEETISGIKDEKVRVESIKEEEEEEEEEEQLDCHRTNSNLWPGSGFLDPQTSWSDVKISRKKPDEEIDTVGPPEPAEEKEVCVDPGNLPKNIPWKADINAMGVSYKIKRLKQHLLVVEKLTSREAVFSKSHEKKHHPSSISIKGFHLLLSLMNKQVQRYQTLEDKANDLCKRMNENEQVGRSRDEASDRRTSEQVEALEMFLGETFKLQMYMVATGQKLMEIQCTIASSLINNADIDSSSSGGGRVDKLAGFNMAQFSDIVRCLLREIQRGMEVRITQIIADLEGILARDVIARF